LLFLLLLCAYLLDFTFETLTHAKNCCHFSGSKKMD
jgi:hypothetical protein